MRGILVISRPHVKRNDELLRGKFTIFLRQPTSSFLFPVWGSVSTLTEPVFVISVQRISQRSQTHIMQAWKRITALKKRGICKRRSRCLAGGQEREEWDWKTLLPPCAWGPWGRIRVTIVSWMWALPKVPFPTSHLVMVSFGLLLRTGGTSPNWKSPHLGLSDLQHHSVLFLNYARAL